MLIVSSSRTGDSAETGSASWWFGRMRPVTVYLPIFGVLAATSGIFFLFNILGSAEGLTARFSVDDSFYYFQTAWQSARSGFVTFDGTHETNGVHFLWFALLYAVALFLPNKILFLQAAYGVALGLVFLVYGLIWHAGTRLDDRRRRLTLLFGVMWTVILAGRSNQLFIGMESTLHMATLWASFVAFLTFAEKLDSDAAFPGLPFLWLSVCLVLVTWTRLDSVVFAAVLYGAALGLALRRKRNLAFLKSKLVWVSFGIICIGAAVQIGFFLQSAGTYIPISGLIKAGSPHEPAAVVMRGFVSILFPFGAVGATREAWFPVIGGGAFLSLFLYVLCQACRPGLAFYPVFQFSAFLGVGAIIFAAISCSHFDVFSRWYLAPVYMFYILGCSCFLYRSFYERRAPSGPGTVFPAVVTTALYLLSVTGMLVSYSETPLYLARYHLGHFLREETAPDDVLASFNAGQLAYFSDRKVVNLDGLANDRRYFEQVLNKESAIIAYLRNENVKYIVDYSLYWAEPEISKNTAILYTLPASTPEGFIFTVRRMTSE